MVILKRMRVPLLDLKQQYRALAEPIQAQIEEVLRTQQFVLGPKVEQFEDAICAYTGAKFAIGVSSGTDALLAILMAVGIGEGDAVITSAYTFFATAASVARVGATPLFVDIDPATYNLSAAKLEEFLKTRCRQTADGPICDGRRIRAIVPVHLFGLCCEMDDLRAVAETYRLPIIEDAAQALGAQYPGRNGTEEAGTMGRAGCFSFYPSKNLGAAGDAGMIVTNDERLAELLRLLRQHGMEQRYFHRIIGGNFRLDAIQAAILSVKLPYLDEWSAARRRAAAMYREEFERANLEGEITLPAEPFRESGVKNHHIFHQYLVRAHSRDELREYLREQEIGSAVYYPLGLHEQECFAGLRFKRGDLPETERAAEETLALPMFPEITPEAQRYVVSHIGEFYRR